MCATGSFVCAPRNCDEETTEASVKKSKDMFGFMDSKYDLNDEDYYDDDYMYDDDDEDLANNLRAEEAKKEFDLLSDADKRTVMDLERRIQSFQFRSESTTGTPSTTTTTTSTASPLPDLDFGANEDEDLIRREDHIVEKYDELLQRSRSIRTQLQRLRDSLSDLEREKEGRHHMHTANHHHADINTIDTDRVQSERRRIDRKHKKYRAYRDSLLSSQQHDRRLSQVDNDIWEDQWKAKVSKHHHQTHDGLTNHL